MTADRSRERARLTKLARGLIGIAAGIVLVVLVVDRFSSRDQLIGRISSLQPSALALPLALGVAAFALSVLRWQIVLASMGIRVAFGRCLRAVLAAWPVAAVSPARAGDAVRALALLDEAPAAGVVGSVVLEKLFDLHSLAVLLCLGAVGSSRPDVAIGALAAIVAFWCAFCTASRIARWQARSLGGRLARVSRWLQSLANAMEMVRSRPSYVVKVVATSLLGWVLSTRIIHLLLAAAGQSIDWRALLLIWPGATLATAVPIGIAGIGPRDGTFLLISSWVIHDVDPAALMAATLVYPVITSGIYAVVGFPVLVSLVAKVSRRQT